MDQNYIKWLVLDLQSRVFKKIGVKPNYDMVSKYIWVHKSYFCNSTYNRTKNKDKRTNIASYLKNIEILDFISFLRKEWYE